MNAMKLIKASATTSLFVIAVVAGPVLRAQDKADDQQTTVSPAVKQIVGDYSIQAGKSNGQELIKDRVTDVTVRITERTITTYDRERREQYSASYRLDTNQRPWKLLMTAIPKKPRDPSVTGEKVPANPASTQGLIEMASDGQRLKLIYALPGGQPPRDFIAQEGQNLFELVRLDPDKATSSPDKATR